MSSNVHPTSAEEAFLEQTPWANPQHPYHQHQNLSHRPQNRIIDNSRMSAFATPAGQMRVVDVNAPNGSASTIAENSSANNTPYGMEQDNSTAAIKPYPDYDARLRSLSSSPTDVRKPHPAMYTSLDHRPPQGIPRNPGYSSPPSRLVFGSAPKRDTSPSLSSKPVNSLRQPAAMLGSTSQNQMAAR